MSKAHHRHTTRRHHKPIPVRQLDDKDEFTCHKCNNVGFKTRLSNTGGANRVFCTCPSGCNLISQQLAARGHVWPRR